MTQEAFLHRIAELLEAAGVQFMVAGSHVSGHFGIPRATIDVDIVIDPTPLQWTQFLSSIPEDYYVAHEAARDAFRRRSMFNIIDFANGWKVDLIVCKDRPFNREEFRRRIITPLYGRPVPLASPEDIILAKLEWNKITPSDRQWQDAFNVAVVQWPDLDQAYLRHWAAELSIATQLEEILRLAEKAQPSK